MKLGLPIVFCFLLMAGPAHSETKYVKDDIQVMVRTDPGARRRIVAMPTSGTRVEVLDTEGGWSKVRLPDEKEGWMLSHYLDSGPPNKVVIATLKRENEALKQRVQTLVEENPRLKNERKNLRNSWP